MKPEDRGVPPPQREARILPGHLAPDSLSIVVFGPGRGEAIVIVLPDGSVGVVDGCGEPLPHGKGDPARDFLEEWAKARGGTLHLRFVCLTHPHADHYGGLGRLLNAYRGRVDAVWTVLPVGDRYAETLVKFVDTTLPGELPDAAAARGLERILAELDVAYHPKPAGGGADLRLLIRGTNLLQAKMKGKLLSVSSCGPASEDIMNAQKELISGVKELAEEGEHSARFDPNVVSGALLFRWGKAGILLGGDLICTHRHYLGWDKVQGDIQSPIQVLKVAHHASKEAHHEELWQRLRVPLAIVTPFKEAKSSMPPRPEQISLLARDAVVAITAKPKWKDDTHNPVPVQALPGTAAKPARGARSRNPRLKLTPTPGPTDMHNAVAVSLSATGELLRFVLAGKADIYEPPAGSTP